MKTDVLIIGGGLMGFSVALQLARRGVKSLVVDKDSAGRHASGVNAGGLRRLNRHPAEIPLSVAAAEMWFDIKSLVDSDCDSRFPGQIRIAENETDVQILEQRVELVTNLGYQHEEMISQQELYKLAPTLIPNCKAALMCRNDGYARPFHALDAFRRKALSLGVEYLPSTRIDAIEHDNKGWRLNSPNGEFRAPVLVNCAGAWAGQVASTLDEPVPLQPGAPMLMITERLPQFIEPVFGAASRKLSFKQMQNGTLLIGGAHMAELDIKHQKTTMNWAKLAVSARTVLALFPQLKNVRIVRCWAGIEAFMPDNLPVISRSSKYSDAFHAFGFSAHGFQLSPLVGIILSQLILDDHTNFNIEPFSIERFNSFKKIPA
ncbi:MAG: FAD-binding oxidoreductase [Gammaproteobacteria bacterium]|jgi:sarcosine oxidase subunit beta|nr:FAD-binding oxidoreductase [Gammaproteobacteria bacterium]MBT3723775.1 FAD-binding oxidoreductase [Gammaproteobacteria bacterium]MBT4076997.1 FAD-binding oxidoreductase [Gammaproteobacteria bacterium]MBT4196431.1 FAD-binding oxidoreductase [Gammaproteobacteria bacterium]MBT4448148.1 FAD-binding oxidoreductase [Gammaproteobacteria bacterium]